LTAVGRAAASPSHAATNSARPPRAASAAAYAAATPIAGAPRTTMAWIAVTTSRQSA